jgi:hypothetical protein
MKSIVINKQLGGDSLLYWMQYNSSPTNCTVCVTESTKLKIDGIEVNKYLDSSIVVDLLQNTCSVIFGDNEDSVIIVLTKRFDISLVPEAVVVNE